MTKQPLHSLTERPQLFRLLPTKLLPLQRVRPDFPPPCGEGLGVPTADGLRSPIPCPSPTRGEGTLRHLPWSTSIVGSSCCAKQPSLRRLPAVTGFMVHTPYTRFRACRCPGCRAPRPGAGTPAAAKPSPAASALRSEPAGA